MSDPMDVRHFTFRHRGGVYHTAVVEAGGHKIEVTCSPTGRSVHLHVNGDCLTDELKRGGRR